MPLYVDTSCLLKAFFLEPETPRVLELLVHESRVIVSSLTRLEAVSHIHARVAGRELSAAAAKRLVGRVDQILQGEPYEVVRCPPGVIEAAEAQVRPLVRTAYCRTLDRLHLATMQTLGLRRLMTNDDVQAAAARGLGLEVVMPRARAW